MLQLVVRMLSIMIYQGILAQAQDMERSSNSFIDLQIVCSSWVHHANDGNHTLLDALVIICLLTS